MINLEEEISELVLVMKQSFSFGDFRVLHFFIYFEFQRFFNDIGEIMEILNQIQFKFISLVNLLAMCVDLKNK